jgi:DNA-binding CsgD family transcriptional regulator
MLARADFEQSQGGRIMSTESVPSLSKREAQVLGLVARGLQTADVARLLQISAHTVCTHVKSIYRKRHLCSRAEAALEAQRLGLV